MKCSTCHSDLAIYGERCCACRSLAIMRILPNYTTTKDGRVFRSEHAWNTAPMSVGIRKAAISRDGDGHRQGVSFMLLQP